MNYYCYCTSNIKNTNENPNQIKNYSDLDNKVENSTMVDIDQNINITPDKIELKNHKIFENQNRLTFFSTYNDFFIIAFNNSNKCSSIYKTDKEFNIIQNKIFYETDNLCISIENNAIIHRNNLIFSNKYFYKLDLDTFEIQQSSQAFEFHANYYNRFAIHKKNNYIYIPHLIYKKLEENEDEKWNTCVSVINIKTLNVIKQIIIIDPDLYLQQQPLCCWCVVQHDKLIINLQFDHSSGFNFLITLKDINKKNVPKTCDIAEYNYFIDEYYHLYKKYLYMEGKGLIFDINNNKFIDLLDNCRESYKYWKIYKNFLIIIRYELKHYKLYIVDLDTSPFLNNVKYEIQLDKNIENSKFYIDNNKLYVINPEKYKFYSYDLPL